MRAAVAARPHGMVRTVRFIASSGHELGHPGLHDYLRRNPALAREAYAWVHFGANIGTSTGDTGMTRPTTGCATPRCGRLRRTALKRSGNRFHNPRDLWPDAVDVRAVARFARAAADLTLSLANMPAA